LLQTVPGSVEIYNDASLTDLTAFPNLTSIGAFLNIQGNTSLLDVTGFAKLAAVHGYFNILNNPTLKNISGFPLLDRVYQDFLIGSNVTLAHVTGFPALHAVDGSFTVADNTQLLDFDGIDTLASVGVDLGVLRNASLTKLDGLASGTLVSVGNDLDIEVNPALTRCRVDAFATQLASAQPGLAGMNHSAANLGCTTCSGLSCSAGSGTLNGQSGTYRGSIVLSGATIVSSNLALYRYVTAITGSLSLTSTSLTSLNGLDNLTSLGGAFDIESNAGLTQCAPTALLSVLQAHGYPAGTAVIMNNLPCSTTCAGAVCQ
jgi:hypothetical protein